jgi:hypothetical protein
MKRGQSLECTCQHPPFNFKDYERVELGEDAYGAEVSLSTCKRCGTVWLNYLIEQPHYSHSGRWWRAEVGAENEPNISVAAAKGYIESQTNIFVGGSFFNSTGHSIKGPTHIA